MEGIWFYWISWISWVFITFLWRKHIVRTQLAFLLLMLIATAHQTIKISSFEISIGYFLFFLSLFIYSSKIRTKQLPYLIICVMILSMAYVTFYLFSLFDPVWVFFHPTIMLSVVLSYLVLILVKKKQTRFLTFGLGICHGEIVHSFIMNYFSFPYVVGSLSFFDLFAFGLLIISVWNGIEMLLTLLDESTTKTNKRKAGTI